MLVFCSTRKVLFCKSFNPLHRHVGILLYPRLHCLRTKGFWKEMILSSLTSICQNTTARKYKIHERHLKSNLANNTVFPPKGVTSEGKNVLASCARFSLSPLLPPCPREIFHQFHHSIFQWIVYMNYFHSALSEILHSPMWDFPSIQLKDFDSNRTWDNHCSLLSLNIH